MPQIVLNKLRGVNTTSASLQLQPGEAQFSQNIRSRPIDNWVKRFGIEAITSFTDPVMGIFDVELDGFIIPIFQAGGTLYFFPDISTSTTPNPSPYPLNDPLDPNGLRLFLFLVEPAMRAIQERILRDGGLTPVTWPNLFFAPDGSKLNGDTGVTISNAHITFPQYFNDQTQLISLYWPPTFGSAQFPTNNVYKWDLIFFDTVYGLPSKTRAAQLVQSVKTNLNKLLNDDQGAHTYIPNPEGSAALNRYIADDVRLSIPSNPTVLTYAQTLTNLRSSIRLLNSFYIGASRIGDNASVDTSSFGTVSYAAVKSCIISGRAFIPNDLYNADAACADSGPSAHPAMNVGLLFQCDDPFVAGSFFISSRNVPGNINANLLSYVAPNTPAQIFLNLAVSGQAQLAPTTGADLIWSEWTGDAPVFGTNWTSIVVTGSNTYPVITIPITHPGINGWTMQNQIIFLYPDFIVNF